jgi:hypothetical protein
MLVNKSRKTPASLLASAFKARGRPASALGYFILDEFMTSIGETPSYDERDIPTTSAQRVAFFRQQSRMTCPTVKQSDPAFCVLKTKHGDYIPVTHMVKPTYKKGVTVNRLTDIEHHLLKRQDYTYVGWVTVGEAIGAGVCTAKGASIFAQRWGRDEQNKAFKQNGRSPYPHLAVRHR